MYGKPSPLRIFIIWPRTKKKFKTASKKKFLPEEDEQDDEGDEEPEDSDSDWGDERSDDESYDDLFNSGDVTPSDNEIDKVLSSMKDVTGVPEKLKDVIKDPQLVKFPLDNIDKMRNMILADVNNAAAFTITETSTRYHT